MKRKHINFIKYLIVGLIMISLLSLVGCSYNRTIIDTTWSFEEAYVSLPGGEVVHGKLQEWKDFDQSDMIQVKIDGKVYLTHSCNVVLVSTK